MTRKQYALIGILTPFLFLIVYLIMSSLRPEYSFQTKAISELGTLDAPNKWIWNIAGYIIPGLLIAVFSYGLFKNIGGKYKLPQAGMMLSGIFMSIAGVFPGDMDDRTSVTMLLHMVGSFGSFLFFLIGSFTAIRLLKTFPHWRPAAGPILVFTWMSILAGTWPFIFPEMPSAGQRITFFFYFLWIFYMAVMLYRYHTKNKHTT